VGGPEFPIHLIFRELLFDSQRKEEIEVLVETFLRKQLGLRAHTVTKVEETERYIIVHIDRLGRRLLRCGVCRQRCRRCTVCANYGSGAICRCGKCC